MKHTQGRLLYGINVLSHESNQINNILSVNLIHCSSDSNHKINKQDTDPKTH